MAKVDHSLGYVLREMHNSYVSVVGSGTFVDEKRVVDYPALSQWLLWEEWLKISILFELC